MPHSLPLDDLEARWLLEAVNTHLEVAESGAYLPTDIEVDTLQELRERLSQMLFLSATLPKREGGEDDY